MSKQVSVKVQIGKREYQTRVSESEVSFVQMAEQRLNDMLSQFESRYQVNDPRDLLAMAALYFAIESVRKTRSAGLSDPEMLRLQEVNDLLGRYMGSL
jgi:cell division protein ZapA (FtsZ GTPase activity inhibitor)